jgi:hypothetical protein
MFEDLIRRGRELAARRAAVARREITARLREEAPPGIRVVEGEEEVVIEARGLRRRAVNEAAVRDLMGRVR